MLLQGGRQCCLKLFAVESQANSKFPEVQHDGSIVARHHEFGLQLLLSDDRVALAESEIILAKGPRQILHCLQCQAVVALAEPGS